MSSNYYISYTSQTVRGGIELTHRDWLVAHSILPKQRNRLMHHASTGLVFVKQVTGQEDKVDFGISCQLENLLEGVDGILTSDRVFFCVTNVIVGCKQDTEAAGLISLAR